MADMDCCVQRGLLRLRAERRGACGASPDHPVGVSRIAVDACSLGRGDRYCRGRGAGGRLLRALRARGARNPGPLGTDESWRPGASIATVRNPMYLGVVGAIAGQALLFTTWALAAYGAAVWACTALFARYYEEPALLRAHGEKFRDYRAAVPAWLPRSRRWTPRAAADPRRRPN